MPINLDPSRAGHLRDKTYPSEVAAVRPKLTTRIHCQEDYEEMSSDAARTGSESDNRCKEFNEQLRSGLGVGRPFLQDGPNEE